jgi:small-conductance mechanosensitive channel
MDQTLANLAVAIAAGLGTTLVLLTLIWFLHRNLRVIRQLSFVLSLAGVAGGWLVFVTLWGGDTSGAIGNALTWLILLLIVVLVLKVIGLYLFEVVLRSRDAKLPALVPKVAYFTAYMLAVLPTLMIAFPGLNIGPLLASGAVTSLVLGLALQPILGNFFSGLVISLERPFRIDDWIKFGDIEAKVVAITWRTTRLRTRDNDDLVVPNARIAQEDIVNFYYPHPLHMERVYVGVHYRTPPYQVKQAMLRAASRVDKVLDKPSPAVFLFDFDDSAITYELRIWIEDIADKPGINDELRSAIWESFRRAGITIPFPIRTLEIEPKRRRLDLVQLDPDQMDVEGIAPVGRLVVVEGADEGQKFPLGSGRVTVGRAGECNFVLSEPRASSQHLAIEWSDEEGYTLTDLESQNGTRVNGKKVTERRLLDMDRIEVGATVIVFEANE